MVGFNFFWIRKSGYADGLFFVFPVDLTSN